MFKHPSYTRSSARFSQEPAQEIVRMKAPGWQNNYLERRDCALFKKLFEKAPKGRRYDSLRHRPRTQVIIIIAGPEGAEYLSRPVRASMNKPNLSSVALPQAIKLRPFGLSETFLTASNSLHA
ncbi:MAG TPA: hypothetical protein VGN95_14325 [Pyrinomonadaceae bacterium]|jgi:hypothetical protein|nr:hypothetical protein [Pyrinomonadaceae bacterium]